ncbi:hypothetical protein ABT247_22425 [Kitasatospora sp. NPDC001539]
MKEHSGRPSRQAAKNGGTGLPFSSSNSTWKTSAPPRETDGERLSPSCQ